MFDGILKNMLTDGVRFCLVALASYLYGTGTDQTQARNSFIAAGLTIFAGFWAWYENRGHQLIVDKLNQYRTAAQAQVPNTRPNSPRGVAPLIAFFLAVSITLFGNGIGFGNGTAEAQQSTPPIITKSPITPAQQFALQASQGCTPSLCSGITIGGTIGAGILAGNFGAQYYNGTAMVGVDIGLGGQLYTDASQTYSENGFFGYQVGEVGGSLSGLLGFTPPANSLASAIAAEVITTYALAGAVEHNIAGVNENGWAIGGGTEFAVSSKIFADLKLMQVSYPGSSKISEETLMLAAVKYKF